MTSNIPSLMATMRHRKLFPAENETNQTDCSEFCDPPCSYNCYPFTDFYYPPPPPSPPLSAVDHNDQSQNISPYIIILLSLIATSLLIVGYYIVIAKSCAGFCRRNNNNEHDEPSQSDTIDEDFIDENHVDHPIWFITTVGLHQSIINSITVCKYKKGEGLIEGTECSVCLNEFQEDETLRLLPKCNHAFHIPCIDTWLRSHTNCPLCRAIIVTDSLSSNMARPPTLSSSDQNGEALVVNEETQMGIINYENDIQVGENRIRAVTEINEGDQILQIDDDHGIISKEAVNSQEDEIQPVRSSVSMDSHSSSIIYEVEDLCSAECEENSITQLENDERYNPEMAQSKDDEDGNSDTIRLIRRASKDQCLHLSPVSMKRSFSCGGRFLPTKHHRSFNSVLLL